MANLLTACLLLIQTHLLYPVDPSIITALAYTESNCKAKAVSHAGAIGILQIMPSTAKGVWSECITGEKYNKNLLYNLEINLLLGACYLDRLIKKYESLDLALAHYNGGPRQVYRMKRFKNINYETANFVNKVRYLLSLLRKEF